jgi:site-specific recombinase XerC
MSQSGRSKPAQTTHTRRQEDLEEFLKTPVQVNWQDTRRVALTELLYTTGWRLDEIQTLDLFEVDTIARQLEAPSYSRFVAHLPMLPQLGNGLCESLVRSDDTSTQSPTEGEE